MVLIKPPTNSRHIPIVISVPHAGLTIPEETRAIFRNGNSKMLMCDMDFKIDELYDFACDLGATFVTQEISRYVIDVNKSTSQYDAGGVEGAEKPRGTYPLGLIWYQTLQDEETMKRPLTKEELDDRIKKYYVPFHNTLKEAISGVKNRFGYCIHVDGHSCTPVGKKAHIDNGQVRKDIILSDLEGTSCNPRMRDLIKDHFEKSGYSVSLNYPFKGGFITKSYGRPAEGVHTIQIEVSRGVYMDSRNYTLYEDRFTRLKETAKRLIKQLSEFNPA